VPRDPTNYASQALQSPRIAREDSRMLGIVGQSLIAAVPSVSLYCALHHWPHRQRFAFGGYDILDVAETCEFEEIAHLMVHDTLSASTELAACKTNIS